MSFALPVLPGRISVDNCLQNASVFPGLCEISAALRTTVRVMSSGVPKYRRHDLWKVNHTTAGGGVPSCCKRAATWKFVP